MDITEDEGFYVDKPVLESVTVCRDTSRLTRPVDFEPRYVCAMGLLRYQTTHSGENLMRLPFPLTSVRFCTPL